ncbi:unnamed protein product [Rotaria sp. Silwood2]|nr:unnamed protein product [Rotaria sp. Silwood2]
MMLRSTEKELLLTNANQLEVSDERKCAQRHQYSRPTIQTKKLRKLNSAHTTLGRSRVPGRAWKRQELENDHRHFTVNALKQKRQQHTLLTRLIYHGHSECVQVVLEKIFSGKIYPTMVDHVCSTGRTALWYACKNGDLNLARQLIERGHAHISKCGVLIVAAQNGHANIVEYLLSMGCDPNRQARNYNKTALHAASRRNHLAILNLLLKHGANSAALDYKKRTPLEYAIHKRHIEIAKALIYHQNGHFDKNQFGFTPLMMAMNFNKTQIVDILMDTLPRQQVLNELALLACKYTIEGYASRQHQAYSYFENLLSMTTPVCNNATCEAYESFSECRTLNELAAISHDNNAMRMHALLVSERLSLTSSDLAFHLRLIAKQSDVYRRRRLLHRCLQLRLHAYKLENFIRNTT